MVHPLDALGGDPRALRSRDQLPRRAGRHQRDVEYVAPRPRRPRCASHADHRRRAHHGHPARPVLRTLGQQHVRPPPPLGTTWLPAAWLGGLVYGFSSFALEEAAWASGRITYVFAVAPPLIVLVIDKLIKQEWPPLVGGSVIGLLGAFQLFVSEEILSIIVFFLALTLIVLAVFYRRQIATRRGRPPDRRGRGASRLRRFPPTRCSSNSLEPTRSRVPPRVARGVGAVQLRRSEPHHAGGDAVGRLRLDGSYLERVHRRQCGRGHVLRRHTAPPPAGRDGGAAPHAYLVRILRAGRSCCASGAPWALSCWQTTIASGSRGRRGVGAPADSRGHRPRPVRHRLRGSPVAVLFGVALDEGRQWLQGRSSAPSRERRAAEGPQPLSRADRSRTPRARHARRHPRRSDRRRRCPDPHHPRVAVRRRARGRPELLHQPRRAADPGRPLSSPPIPMR